MLTALLLPLLTVWPVPAPVSRDYAPPPVVWAPGHRGIDLVAPAGTPVRAPRAGVIAWTGSIAGREVVVITHGHLRSTYEPVAATLEVGTAVSAGDVIGVAIEGTSHCSSTCVHWGLRRGREYLDPRLLLRQHARLTR